LSKSLPLTTTCDCYLLIPSRLRDLEGDWHEFESKALRKENERRDKEAKKEIQRKEQQKEKEREKRRTSMSISAERDAKRLQTARPA
jgi:CTD kinase subunit alpha